MNGELPSAFEFKSNQSALIYCEVWRKYGTYPATSKHWLWRPEEDYPFLVE
jgi:hypothetical protein